MNARPPSKAHCLRSALWAVLAGLCIGGAWAQSPLTPQTKASSESTAGAPVLKPSSLLPVLVPAQNRALLPLFIQADHLSGRPDLDLLMLDRKSVV